MILCSYFVPYILILRSPSTQNIEDYVRSGKAGPDGPQVEKLLVYPNIPRKKNKFVNFVSNCLNIRNPQQVERIWSVVEAANRKQPTPELKEQSNENKRVIPVSNGDQKVDKKRIRREDEFVQKEEETHVDAVAEKQVTCEQSNSLFDGSSCRAVESQSPDPESCGKRFSWKKTIKQLLSSSQDKRMQLKQLKRQVSQLSLFSKHFHSFLLIFVHVFGSKLLC